MTEQKQPDFSQNTNPDDVLLNQQDTCNTAQNKDEYPEAMEVPASEPLAIPRKSVK